MEDITRNTSNRKDLVDKTIDTINKCIDYRQATMNVFGDALDKVRSEDEPDIKPLAVTLKGKYQDEKDGHQTQIKRKRMPSRPAETSGPRFRGNSDTDQLCSQVTITCRGIIVDVRLRPLFECGDKCFLREIFG